MPTIGFIGTGNMGGSLARAAARTGGSRLLLSNRTMAKAELLASQIGAEAVEKSEIIKQSDFIFLGVKPQMLPTLSGQIRDMLAERGEGFTLVSMAAGTSISAIGELLGKNLPVIRIMPNTPASIGMGMILYCCSENVSRQTEEDFLSAMSGAGRFMKLEERLIDAGSSVSGCGPAFADMFIEALADGGVACGLPRAQAIEMAAQMLMGSAALLLDSGRHPGELKDAVCSPGGTTIQGVRKLEERGFRGAVMDAVIAAYEKNFAL